MVVNSNDVAILQSRSPAWNTCSRSGREARFKYNSRCFLMVVKFKTESWMGSFCLEGDCCRKVKWVGDEVEILRRAGNGNYDIWLV